MYIKLYLSLCNLPWALTYQNLHDRVATIKFIATGHAGTTQAMPEHHPSKFYMYGAPFSMKKTQHTVLQVTLVVCRSECSSTPRRV